MICSFCNKSFKKNQGIDTCSSCPVKGCGMIKCPYCEYENILETRFSSILKRFIT